MTVLSGAEIERRLNGSTGRERIFVPGTECRDCVRRAAYDLRVAPDYLILPDGTRYWPEGPDGRQERMGPFLLEPKDVAFVSSVEELRMPPNIAGNIAPRFRRALEGILVIGGMLVDPGYCGRLHFQLVNIGDKTFEITPEETSVAAMQFLELEILPSEAYLPSHQPTPGSEDLLKRLFYLEAKEPLPPLAFFSDVGDLRKEVDALKEQANDQRIELDSTKRSTDQLLVFGVFLVSITLFTVAAGVLIDAIAGGSIEGAASTVEKTELTLPGLAVAAALLAVVGAACWLMMRPVYRIVEAHRKKDAEGPGKESAGVEKEGSAAS